jgi:hypothetical protein
VPETPILIDDIGWSALRWLRSVQPTGHERSRYIVHEYEPQEDYTRQDL